MLNKAEADRMIVSHRAWVSKFKTKLYGLNTEEIDPNHAGDFTSCELGQMLASTQIEVTINNELTKKHEEFHNIAQLISEMINQGTPRDDIEIYIEALDNLSIDLIQKIRVVLRE